MAGELESSEQSPAEMETEFGSYPEEIRRAALEYARGLQLGQPEPEALPDEGDVQFVLVGVEQAGRAMLFASGSVTEAKFARRFDGLDHIPIGPNGPIARVPRYLIYVAAQMRDFDQHVGDDYASALATMLADWQRRRQAQQQEIGPKAQS